MTAPVEAAARLEWQREAHAMVGGFLDAAESHDLPVISWTLGRNCRLTGYVDGPGMEGAAKRAAFEAWAAHLGATPVETLRGGVVHLRADFEAGQGGGTLRTHLTPAEVVAS